MIQKFKSTQLYHIVRNIYLRYWQIKEFNNWEKNGKSAPSPHLVKQIEIVECSKKNNSKILVETGTYYGDMVEAMKKKFDKIYTIELSDQLFQMAKNRFKHQNNIEIFQGNSAILLHDIIKNINEPAIFWLDGHYSSGITAKGEKETPIKEELFIILNSNKLNHIILIDDARSFGTQLDYPTIDELSKFIFEFSPEACISVKDDIIRVELN